MAASTTLQAQSELYPKHFDLEQVTLLDGPMKTAMETNYQMLLQYDVDRLLTPFVRQAGLAQTTDKSSKYYQWLTKHPNFKNWGGDAGFDLSGHVGGHYLSALALAYASCRDVMVRGELWSRLQYMLSVMKDCQDAYNDNTEGLYGCIGGQPINDSWKKLYQGDLSGIQGNWGWVPFYCQHKILAGLRDAYIYTHDAVAKELFRKLADWSVNVVSKVDANAFESFLNCEHGGMNESMLDAYQLFGDQKYLTAAKKYTHKAMLNGMQTLNTTFLDGKHANTQVPKYIGMERICEQDEAATGYKNAAENFWTDVADNRTVCIGGNSVGEHFLAKANSNRYIDHLDGPESCNSNNMLKLSEMMSDRTADARYADFYEATMWNHILSTQDPQTGGYVYFTTLRPQGYRIYSQVNQGMWCCVGTGMENHSKYGHFIYTHDGDKTLYVNLFTPSVLDYATFGIRQETLFPCIDPVASNIPTSNTATTTLTITKAGTYAIAVRHPAWVGKEYQVMVNGKAIPTTSPSSSAPSSSAHPPPPPPRLKPKPQDCPWRNCRTNMPEQDAWTMRPEAGPHRRASSRHPCSSARAARCSAASSDCLSATCASSSTPAATTWKPISGTNSSCAPSTRYTTHATCAIGISRQPRITRRATWHRQRLPTRPSTTARSTLWLPENSRARPATNTTIRATPAPATTTPSTTATQEPTDTSNTPYLIMSAWPTT